MKSRAMLIAAAVVSASALLLTGCTSGTPTPVTSTPVPVTSSSQGTVTVPTPVTTGVPDPERYALTSQSVPGTLTLLLNQNGKFVAKPSSLTGGTYNSTCGYTFVSQKLVSSATALAPADMQAQSIKLVTDYAQKAGVKKVNTSVDTLNTNQQITASTDNYTIEAESATIATSKYAGVVDARVFSDGTGVLVAFLCRAGSTVPTFNADVVLNVG